MVYFWIFLFCSIDLHVYTYLINIDLEVCTDPITVTSLYILKLGSIVDFYVLIIYSVTLLNLHVKIYFLDSLGFATHKIMLSLETEGLCYFFPELYTFHFFPCLVVLTGTSNVMLDRVVFPALFPEIILIGLVLLLP